MCVSVCVYVQMRAARLEQLEKELEEARGSQDSQLQVRHSKKPELLMLLLQPNQHQNRRLANVPENLSSPTSGFSLIMSDFVRLSGGRLVSWKRMQQKILALKSW